MKASQSHPVSIHGSGRVRHKAQSIKTSPQQLCFLQMGVLFSATKRPKPYGNRRLVTRWQQKVPVPINAVVATFSARFESSLALTVTEMCLGHSLCLSHRIQCRLQSPTRPRGWVNSGPMLPSTWTAFPRSQAAWSRL